MRPATVSPAAPVEPAVSDRRWFWTAFFLSGTATLIVRLLLFVGYQARDDRNYVAYAYYLATHGSAAGLDAATQWVGRIGFWLPLAASMRLFGYGELALSAYTLLFSVIGAALLIALGQRVVGRRATAIAAVFYVVMPLDVLYATRPYTDLPTGILMVAALYLALRALDEDSVATSGALGLAVGLGYLHKEVALFAGAPIAALYLQRLRRNPRRLARHLAAATAGFLIFFGCELALWTAWKGDPLYRYHSADTALDRALTAASRADHSGGHRWIPGPKPTEMYRSSNSILDAILMFAVNEEFGVIFWLAWPIVIWLSLRRDSATAALRLWIVTLTLLMLFVPVHWPLYTMPRDPRYYTCLTIPVLLVLAAAIVRWRKPIGMATIAVVVATSAMAAFIGQQASILANQRALLALQRTDHLSPLWVSPQLASELIVLSRFDPALPLRLHLLDQGPSSESYRAVMIMRPDVEVASGPERISGGWLVRGGTEKSSITAPPGWTLANKLSAPADPFTRRIQAVLRAVGVPASMWTKLSPYVYRPLVIFRPAGASERTAR